ncbi:BMC domain-containing protein [Romboutsia sedimentorum]|uniref:BMC domain-containing protein n=1 Tax=Romboutsia sedimentorum TaxID=1368474 RepID=A0ABT7EBJ1_9FIRM|nr:BMC domain-containing protein [Romboutsia sedimentorum]MDK2564067.1 BMC domain-containing protein [Romboutsia sedimentorum]
MINALGLVEVIGYVAAIEACDVCLKSANVHLVGIDKVGSGIVTVSVTGDVGAVKSAVESAQASVSRIGSLRSTHVIPRLHQDVVEALFKKEENKENFSEEDTTQIKINEAILLKEDLEKEIQSEVLNNELENINENKTNENNTNEDKDDLSKMSVKELKTLIKKLDNSITHKNLNSLRKEDLIDMVEKFNREDK